MADGKAATALAFAPLAVVLADGGAAAALALASLAPVLDMFTASSLVAVVLADGRFAAALAFASDDSLLFRQCSQMDEPPQLLHSLLRRPCSQMTRDRILGSSTLRSCEGIFCGPEAFCAFCVPDPMAAAQNLSVPWCS